MLASRPKVGFWQDGNTSPGNYGLLFVHPLKPFRIIHAPVILPFDAL
jgi:hypothetical protein